MMDRSALWRVEADDAYPAGIAPGAEGTALSSEWRLATAD